MSDTPLARLAGRHRQFLDFLTPRVGSRDQAEEILQTAFLKAVEKGASLRHEESAVAWSYRVLRNALVDHYRHQDAEHRALERHAHDSTGGAGLDAETEQAACRCVLSVLDDVKPEQAALLRRVDIGGEAIGDVARASGLSAGTARVRLHRAHAALRRQVELVCRTCATHGCFDCTCRV
ncbi:MAG TPA: RNA polymerase sigma factor [Gemmatimonadales bacterium]